MNKIYFNSVEISGGTENNTLFYTSEDMAKKDMSEKISEELKSIQKLINDYSLDVPIMKQILKNLSVTVHTREFSLTKEKAS